MEPPIKSQQVHHNQNRATPFPQKIILVANTGWFLYNYSLLLANSLRKIGIETIFISPQDVFSEKLVSMGFGWYDLKLQRASLNPLSALRTMIHLAKIYSHEQPNVVHHYTPKCVFFGTFAAQLSRVTAIVNSVTGLGHVAEDTRLIYKTIFLVQKMLYRLTLKSKKVKVILENPDDFAQLLHYRLIRPDNCTRIPGGGVDISRYLPVPSPVDGNRLPPTILFASRLLECKGIYELIAAARIVKMHFPEARFWIAGAIDPGNPTSISAQTVAQWQSEGIVEMLGHQDPIDSWIARATIVVLPSYREGLPKILLEASAMEKPIVTTDVPGCREVVKHEVTGLLVKPKDINSLADALLKLLGDVSLQRKMGLAGRQRVIDQFSSDKIIGETMSVYRSFKKELIKSSAR